MGRIRIGRIGKDMGYEMYMEGNVCLIFTRGRIPVYKHQNYNYCFYFIIMLLLYL